MENLSPCIARAGELFMLIGWIQGQMNDLNVFHQHPHLVEPFMAEPVVLPAEFVALRVEGWEAVYKMTAERFITCFADCLLEWEIDAIRQLGGYRNTIAHAHVSLDRDYLLYRPNSTSQKSDAFKRTLATPSRQPSRFHPLYTLDLSDDANYVAIFERIKRLDEVCMSKVAASLGIGHNRIR